MNFDSYYMASPPGIKSTLQFLTYATHVLPADRIEEEGLSSSTSHFLPMDCIHEVLDFLPVASSVVVVIGPPSSGKTHLLRMLASKSLAESPSRTTDLQLYNLLSHDTCFTLVDTPGSPKYTLNTLRGLGVSHLCIITIPMLARPHDECLRMLQNQISSLLILGVRGILVVFTQSCVVPAENERIDQIASLSKWISDLITRFGFKNIHTEFVAARDEDPVGTRYDITAALTSLTFAVDERQFTIKRAAVHPEEDCVRLQVLVCSKVPITTEAGRECYLVRGHILTGILTLNTQLNGNANTFTVVSIHHADVPIQYAVPGMCVGVMLELTKKRKTNHKALFPGKVCITGHILAPLTHRIDVKRFSASVHVFNLNFMAQWNVGLEILVFAGTSCATCRLTNVVKHTRGTVTIDPPLSSPVKTNDRFSMEFEVLPSIHHALYIAGHKMLNRIGRAVMVMNTRIVSAVRIDEILE
eukprot:PhF_6_TR22346/c0_g1_i2/m.31642